MGMAPVRLGSNAVAQVAALLLLLSIGVAAASAQLKTQNPWEPKKLGDCQPGVDGAVSCEVKCDLLGCMAGCQTSSQEGCFLGCLAENISCKSTCSVIPFPPDPSPPLAPPASTAPPPQA
ncbi:hypothetical protein QQP08_013151 [Theobroma cacao]|nr:hypothetical protein QQP08_013151 [Theobroma cacao]